MFGISLSHANENVSSQEPTVTVNELKSVRALVAYQAYNFKTSEEIVKSYFESRFRIKRLEELKSKDYEEAVRFLVDLSPESVGEKNA